MLTKEQFLFKEINHILFIRSLSLLLKKELSSVKAAALTTE